jgi:hypothetical protein
MGGAAGTVPFAVPARPPLVLLFSIPIALVVITISFSFPLTLTFSLSLSLSLPISISISFSFPFPFSFSVSISFPVSLRIATTRSLVRTGSQDVVASFPPPIAVCRPALLASFLSRFRVFLTLFRWAILLAVINANSSST